MSDNLSFPKNKIRFALLENVHQAAADRLIEAGYDVQQIPKALAEDDLLDLIKDVHVLGIRSKTKVMEKHFAVAEKLLAVGCFGIGTNQVDLNAARSAGVPVFNAPFSSTRSVAELAVAYIFSLSRGIGFRNNRMHAGVWSKSAKGCHEVRHKTLGLVGYGHIGQQVGLMAEAVGMNVVYFDMIKKLPLGNAQAYDNLDEMLGVCDFVSLHIPAPKDGSAVIGEKELKTFKKGACVINLSRGSVVDLSALKASIESGHLAGAALDVFPVEPKQNEAEFSCEATGCDQILMTPHIGGSTEEAQMNIGLEVATSFEKFVDEGLTMGAVNFPQVSLPAYPESHRILNVHKNVPGVMNSVNSIIAELGANINAQFLSTYQDIGYLIMDLNQEVSEKVKNRISELDSNIKTRILY